MSLLCFRAGLINWRSLFIFVEINTDIMTELIVTVEDLKLLSDLKRAIKMLRGVKDITVRETVDMPNDMTQRAIEELKEGKTIKCRSFEEYLKKVK